MSPEPSGGGQNAEIRQPGQRIDRWLWCARFFKSRTLAQKLCNDRKVRLNSKIVAKASVSVRSGDVLTFPQGRQIRVIRVTELAARRGPAVEARGLYDDLTPAKPRADEAALKLPLRAPGSGRPTKRDRRAIDRLEPKR